MNETSRSENQKHRENGQPLGVISYSLLGGVASAWRKATPERVFAAGFLFIMSWFGLCLSFAVFFGDK